MDRSIPASAPLRPLSLALALAGTLALAAFIVLAAVLPAEYGRDPTGLGRITGLARLWTPEEVRLAPVAAGEIERAHDYDIPFRSDVVEIRLDTLNAKGAIYELEYKFHLRKDATLVFDWEAVDVDDPEDFYFDFHGQTLPADKNEKITVAEYRQGNANRAAGSLVAPFDGIHGWYFQNSATHPVVVRIRASGFYELIEPGEPGNEAGIAAGKPATK